MMSMERLIASIDDILKGDNKMDFEVFNKSELEEMCQTTIDRMPDFMRESIEREFGGIEEWKNHYIERASKEDMQKGYQKLIEWYGDKDTALQSMNNPPSPEMGKLCEEKIEQILAKLSLIKGFSVNSIEVRQLVGEYGQTMKEFLKMKRGEGCAEFFAQAIEAYYKES